MSLFDMTGQVALVTGSSRGIGRAIVEQMAAHGARVVVSSRTHHRCAEVADAINVQHGAGTAIALAANISSKENLQALVDTTRREFGAVTALVCNAASSPHFGPSAGISDEAFRKTLDNNVLSNHWLAHMVAPEMIARGEGSITFVSSIGGLRGSPIMGAYCISKAADMQMARNLADEFGAHGVRVNCIAPGLIRTDLSRALWEDAARLAIATKRASLRRIGEPDEVAGAAVFLASAAGRYVTGQTIVIDGGDTSSSGLA